MVRRSTPLERILVLLEGGVGDAALEAAADLAARRNAQLVGLFVEDSDLLSSAGLPFTREIGMASGNPRPLSAPEVERGMRERAGLLRAQLVHVARERGVEAVLEVGRGRHVQSILLRMRPQDLFVLRRSEWARRPGGVLEGVLAEARCAVLLVSRAPAARRDGPMVLMDGSDGAARALSYAIALARHEGRTLTLLFAPGQDGIAARDETRRRLADEGITAQFVGLGQLSVDEVRRASRREHSRLLLVSRESPLWAQAASGGGLAELDELPLVVVP